MDLDTSINKLLTTLYSAPMQPEQWNVFLAQLSRLTGVSKAALISHDFCDKDHRISACFGDTVKDSIEAYERYYCQFDEWTSRFPKIRVAGRVLSGEEIWPKYLMQRSVFFNEFLKKYDVCQMAVLAGAGSDDVLEALSIYRGPREAPFDKEKLAMLQMLAPHLQTAFSVRRRLLAIESRVTDLENALDQLGTALVLVDLEGKPVLVNRAARGICSQRNGLFLSKSCIAAENLTENRRLRELIAKAISAGMSKGLESGGAMLISRADRRPLQVLAAPFVTNNLGPKGAVAIVFISDPDQKPTLRSNVLQELYGLTQAETRLALSLLDGRSLTETADWIGVTHETVRSQVKSVLQKTGTRRQGELTRLLASLPGV